MIKLIALLAATATPASVLAFVPRGSTFTPTGEQTVELCVVKASLCMKPAQKRMLFCWYPFGLVVDMVQIRFST